VVRVDHVVAELEVDEFEFALRLEIVLQQGVFGCLRNDVLLGLRPTVGSPLVRPYDNKVLLCITALLLSNFSGASFLTT